MTKSFGLALAGCILANVASAALVQNVTCKSETEVRALDICSISDDSGTALASASAKYGILGASGNSSNSGRRLSVGGSGHAFFSDSLTIHSPGLDGQIGTVKFLLLPKWTLGVTTKGIAQAALTFDTQGARKNTYSLRKAVRTESSYTETALNDSVAVPYESPMTGTIEVTFGDSFTISANLNIVANAGLFGSSLANAANTVRWGGITSVKFDGVDVAYSVSSVSGTDWNRAFIPRMLLSQP